MLNSGDKIRLTPPTNARSISPRLKAEVAKSIATKEDEQAVSTTMLGPVKLRKYDNRFAVMLRELPVPKYASMLSRSSACSTL